MQIRRKAPDVLGVSFDITFSGLSLPDLFSVLNNSSLRSTINSNPTPSPTQTDWLSASHT